MLQTHTDRASCSTILMSLLSACNKRRQGGGVGGGGHVTGGEGEGAREVWGRGHHEASLCGSLRHAQALAFTNVKSFSCLHVKPGILHQWA